MVSISSETSQSTWEMRGRQALPYIEITYPPPSPARRHSACVPRCRYTGSQYAGTPCVHRGSVLWACCVYSSLSPSVLKANSSALTGNPFALASLSLLCTSLWVPSTFSTPTPTLMAGMGPSLALLSKRARIAQLPTCTNHDGNGERWWPKQGGARDALSHRLRRNWRPLTPDWCELNYTTSYLIAEFVNTLTNVPVILMGLYGAWSTVASGAPRRYALVFIGLSLIGIGSFGFHCSLKWSWQLMDELPMIYVVSYAAYLVVDTLPGFKPRFGIWGPVLLVVWDVFVTVSYVMLPNPVYHQIAFALIMTSAVLRSAQLILRLPETMRAKLARTLGGGVGIFVLGFAIWNADNYFCVYLRSTRAWLSAHGLGPLGAFTEGHGYWHLATGLGAYRIFIASIQLCLANKTSPGEWDYDETLWFPVVRRVKPIARSVKAPIVPERVDEKRTGDETP